MALPIAERTNMGPRVLASMGCLLACLSADPATAGDRSLDRPNIVLFLSDDQRWDTLQYMPTVRRELVDRGVLFNNSYSAVPSCCPSRAALFSGRWGHNTGVVFNRDTGDAADASGIDLPNGGIFAFDAASSIAVLLQSAGYETAIFGKMMNQNDDFSPDVLAGWDEYVTFVQDGFNLYGADHPFNPAALDYLYNVNGTITTGAELRAATPVHGPFDYNDYSTDLVRDLAVEWLDGLSPGTPFLLVVAPYAPHFDNGFYITHPAERHDGKAAADGIVFDIPPSFNESDISDKPEWLQNALPSVWNAVERDVDALRYQTVDALQAVDEAVAAVLVQIDSMGTADETMVVYTSDNGYLWGEHRLGQKLAMYEESIRVPLVVRFPLERPEISPIAVDDPVSLVDLAPTFADLAGVGGGYNGMNLLPIIRGTASSWRTHLLVETWFPESIVPNIVFPNLFPEMPDAAAVISDQQLKYVDYVTGTDELYDLLMDPFELDNLIADVAYAGELLALQDALNGLRAEQVVVVPEPAPGLMTVTALCTLLTLASRRSSRTLSQRDPERVRVIRAGRGSRGRAHAGL